MKGYEEAAVVELQFLRENRSAKTELVPLMYKLHAINT
jgi:hypothetical protein